MARFPMLRAKVRTLAESKRRNLPAARRLRFALATRALERYAGGRSLKVLDAGCGEGLLGEVLARRHPDWEVIGADLDSSQLAIAARHLQSSELPNLRFSQLDLTRDLGRAEYDAVLALECLEEIPDDGAALASMARALRPGGILVAHVPERDWKPVLPGSDRAWKHEVRHGYDGGELPAKLSEAGLRATVVRPTTRGTVGVVQEIRDRIKDRDIRLQLLLYPAASAAVRLELLGFTWGPPRGLLVEARRE